MDDEAGDAPQRRRRRRRPGEEMPLPGPDVAPGAAPAPPVAKDRSKERGEHKQRRPRQAHEGGERGLRDLVGAGHSQLGVNGALRARDVNRPTDEDLAEAEANVVLVRRNWQPPDVRK